MYTIARPLARVLYKCIAIYSVIVYHFPMLTLTDLQIVFDCSYPTALKFARDHGFQSGDGARAPWLVPVDAVQQDISLRAIALDNMRKRLAAVITAVPVEQ